jgi:hypothetical protein
LKPSWVAEAERVICRIKDVVAAAITTEGDEVREIHVVAVSARAPKQIVRDVETTLKAFLKRPIDHRMISVALQDPPAAPPPAEEAKEKRGNGALHNPAPVRAPMPAPTPAPEPQRPNWEPSVPTGNMRVRFVSANLFVSGLKTTAQVELSWQGMTRLGSATGASARDNAARLLSGATLNALVPYLGDDVTLAPHEVEFVKLGRQEVVLVTVKLLGQRSEKTLVGSCTVEQDMAQSVVYATLSAVNRVLGGLRSREPVEYELRPTST